MKLARWNHWYMALTEEETYHNMLFARCCREWVYQWICRFTPFQGGTWIWIAIPARCELYEVGIFETFTTALNKGSHQSKCLLLTILNALVNALVNAGSWSLILGLVNGYLTLPTASLLRPNRILLPYPFSYKPGTHEHRVAFLDMWTPGGIKQK